MTQPRYDLDLFIELNDEYAQSSVALAQVNATRQDDADHRPRLTPKTEPDG